MMLRPALLLLAALGGEALAAAPAALVPQAGQASARPGPAKAASAGLESREIRAQLAPHRFTTVAAELGARVQRLPVQEGGRFKAGQALVSFDCSLQQAQLSKARAALSGAEQTFQANRRLADLNSIGKVELNVSEAQVAEQRAELAVMSTLVRKCTISAPFAGRVAEAKIREQQFVQPGQVIMEIIDDSVLELEFLVPSKWLSWLKPGSRFTIGIDETGKSYPARLQRIGARVDPVSQSVKLVAAIDGRFPELLTGMSGRVQIAPPGQ
jgi:membrane fusion protein (multidrug efflux system)